jgi:tetratricopeptide (TPR) repeat protein
VAATRPSTAVEPAPAAAPPPAAPDPTAAATPAATEPSPAPTAEAPPTTATAENGPDLARFSAAIQKGKQALARGQFSKTRQALREAAHIKAQSAEVLSLQADLALDEGNAEAALRLARKALHIDPSYADAHLSLAMAAQASADTGTARSHFKKYLELSPNGERAKDVKAILQGRY